ncbi:MAG: hypothetical protein M0Q91_12105 [Methanoregula sp.]|jgi:uncharacterized protein with PIN domain|nr:hypothetical protein [Methanoregula sp.]
MVEDSEDYGAGCIATALIDNHFSYFGYELDHKLIYAEYISSDAWKAKADAAKERAGYRCQICNGALLLEAHHRTYSHLGNEGPNDITVLCHNCHEKFSKSNLP